METKFNYIFNVDIITNTALETPFDGSANVNRYIFDLISNVTSSDGDRLYEFESTTHTMRNYVESLFNDPDNSSVIAQSIANKLLAVETEAQKKISHLDKEIQKGLLILSFVKMTDNEYKLIFSKADFNQFIEESSGEIKSGLPIKKKIFKAFIANISQDGEVKTIDKMMTYDSNSSVSSYWWKEFLELKVVVEDELNTTRAFTAIKKEVINFIFKNHNKDYLPIWNMTVGYFRSAGEFSLEHFRDTLIGEYVPYDTTLSINDLKLKISKLPQKYSFDNRFQKVPSVINKEIKNTISLTNEIDIIIKHEFPEMQNIIIAEKRGDDKYIMIKSELGYNIAEKYSNNTIQ